MHKKTSIQTLLISSWTQYKRDYPWRYHIDAYRVMVAEFMLQRTKADQVAPVYKRFVRQFPTVHSLAHAKTREISNYTRHLGIHWRARHFVHSSRYISKHFCGRIPSERSELLSIPGVGEYVAGAILTIALQKKEWVIDSNIARFLNRLHGWNLQGEIRRKQMVIAAAKKFFCHNDPRRLLFSLLDFAALICTPTEPRCSECPVHRRCRFVGKTNSNRV
jgi:A/G-specific adenine glycosylase